MKSHATYDNYEITSTFPVDGPTWAVYDNNGPAGDPAWSQPVIRWAVVKVHTRECWVSPSQPGGKKVREAQTDNSRIYGVVKGRNDDSGVWDLNLAEESSNFSGYSSVPVGEVDFQ